jgi:hypothetical protein
MSKFSSLVRKLSGGQSVGEVGGRFIGTAVGGPIGGDIGAAIGGAATQELSNATQQGQAVAVSQEKGPPAETSTSGTTDFQNLYTPANFMAGLQRGFMQPAAMISPPLVTRGQSQIVPQQARGVAGIVGGMVLGAAPMIIDLFTGEPKKLIVTRKLKSQVKRSVDLMGIEATAEGMGVDVSVVNYILLKKLRNDGAYVTKAAMRKTSSTLRKMKRMCDMYDDLRPAARRRAPARKSSSIMQVKN